MIRRWLLTSPGKFLPCFQNLDIQSGRFHPWLRTGTHSQCDIRMDLSYGAGYMFRHVTRKQA
jgi:hypothetical protein